MTMNKEEKKYFIKDADFERKKISFFLGIPKDLFQNNIKCAYVVFAEITNDSLNNDFEKLVRLYNEYGKNFDKEARYKFQIIRNANRMIKNMVYEHQDFIKENLDKTLLMYYNTEKLFSIKRKRTPDKDIFYSMRNCFAALLSIIHPTTYGDYPGDRNSVEFHFYDKQLKKSLELCGKINQCHHLLNFSSKASIKANLILTNVFKCESDVEKYISKFYIKG